VKQSSCVDVAPGVCWSGGLLGDQVLRWGSLPRDEGRTGQHWDPHHLYPAWRCSHGAAVSEHRPGGGVWPCGYTNYNNNNRFHNNWFL